jgi:hypothetical protein
LFRKSYRPGTLQMLGPAATIDGFRRCYYQSHGLALFVQRASPSVRT